jgi:hypothetical protein
MRKILIGVAAASLVACGIARAQSPGPFTTAQILPVNGHVAGGYLQTSDSEIGLLSQLRLSFYPGVDFGFQGGFSRLDDGSSNMGVLRIGADVRFGVARTSQGSKVDFALGGGFGVDVGDSYTLLTVGPTAYASVPFSVGSSSTLSPYAVTGISFNHGSVSDVNHNDFTVPINLGLEFRPSTAMALALELQLRPADRFRDDVGLAFGVNLPF